MILLVVMIIGIGALYQFNKAFAKFAENYFGEYLACLLETGELPNLGASTGVNCDSEFEEFNLANGRRRFLPENKSIESTVPPGEDANLGSAGARGGRSQVGRGRRFKRRGATRGATAAAPGEGSDNGSRVQKLGPGQESFASTRTHSFSNSKTGPKRLTSNLAPAKEKEKAAGIKVKKGFGDDGLADRKRRTVIKKPSKKKLEEEDEPWGFGEFIKYLLIAGILLAIVVFLGGQILQFSNADE